MPGGVIEIPMDCIESSEAKYSVNLTLFNNDFTKTTPFGVLIKKLCDKLLAIGFSANFAEVRLEKGCYDSPANYWHLDGQAIREPIIICYGTKENWITHLLPVKNATQIFGDSIP